VYDLFPCKERLFATCKTKEKSFFIKIIINPKLRPKYKLNNHIYNRLKHPKQFWKNNKIRKKKPKSTSKLI
jgi:hypothetical protein